MRDWKRAYCPPEWRSQQLINVVELPSGQVDPRRLPFSAMSLVAPDHVESGSGTVLAFQTAAEQRAISGKYLFDVGDVVYSKIRPYLRKAFLASIVGLCSADMYPLRPRLDELDPRFLLGVVLGEHFSRFAEIVSMRSGFPKINREELAEYIAALPPLPEQRAIAAVLDTIDDAIQKTEQIIAKLQQVKQGLLHDLLTRGIDDNGELRDPERHPEQFQDSPVGRIPKGWEIRLVDDVAARGSGHTPSKRVSSYWNGGVKWVSLADSWRLDQRYIFDTDKEISEQGIANSSAVKHPAGTVILSRDAGVGKSAILGTEMAVSQHFIAWRCSSRLSELYFYYWLQHKKPMFEAIAFGSTILTIGLPFFRRLRIAVPPRREQDAASAQILESELLLSRETTVATKLRSLKAGLADDVLTGRVRTTSLPEFAA